MASLSWWRSWHGAPMDHKWSVIAARSGVKAGIVSAIAWAIFDHASQQEERGSVEGFDIEMYSVYTGFEEIEIAAVLQAMNDKGVITDNKLTNWDKRQPKSESEIQRVTEYREKIRLEKERYELLRDVTGNYTDKDTDKDLRLTDKDIDKTQKKTPTGVSLPTIPDKLNVPSFQEVWQEWIAYRKETKHSLTERTAKSQLKMLERFTPEVAAGMLDQSIRNGWQGLFELKSNGKPAENSEEAGQRFVEEFAKKQADLYYGKNG